MWDYFQHLFDSDFMPHGHCYFWRPDVLWLNVSADSLIALAYYSIPIALIYIVRSRPDLAFDWMFLLFASFIFACGTTHLMEVWTVWNGTYRIHGMIKLITAILSLVTAVLLWRLIPTIKLFPSAARLKEEVDKRMKAQQLLEEAYHGLEVRVADRTEELQRSNVELIEKSDKLQRFYNVTVDREMQMISLKEEINGLLSELHREPKYRVVRGADTSGDE